MNEKNLFILSSVAGGGKSTIIGMLLNAHKDLQFSISCTTRQIRNGEKEGITYYYISIAEFEKKIQANEFLEWAKVHDNYYGTPKSPIYKSLEENRKMILDIDVQGFHKVKEIFPKSTSIFLLPPSIEIWVDRLKARNTETEESLHRRIENGKKELKESGLFDYQIINDDLYKTFFEVERVIYPK